MFNSIRKDDNRRKSVKRFEISRLQTKILVQAMTISDPFATQIEQKKLNIVPFNRVIHKINDKKPSLMFSIPLKVSNLTSPNAFSYKAKLCKSSPSVNDVRSKQKLSILPKVKDKNQKKVDSSKAFSNLLSLAKNRMISLPRNSSKGRIKNRCIETGRSHSILRFCKLSRIGLRDNASKALISGICKASW